MSNGKITLSTLNQKLDFVIAQMKEHDLLLRGTEATPGFLTRVDRLEVSETNRRWHFRTIWAAIIAAIVAFWVK